MTGQWWREGVFYQVYVPSFQDGDGDGFGDLWGVERRLDYIAALGVTAIWLSPVYASPLLDFGYDVSGYTEVGAPFGDLAVFDQLVRGAHDRGLRVVLDYVPQHTSSEHPWFRDALSGRDGAHRDWYIWHDPKPDGGPPNNWASAFGGSSWTFHEPTGQYYYHAHLPEQPSLNWRNPDVQQAMFDVMRFWLDRGVDGFRVDAVWRLIKDAQLRDNPMDDGGESFEIGGAAAHTTVRQVQKYTADQPELPGLLARMHTVTEEYDDRMLMGELHLKLERVAALGGRGLDLAMNFSLIDTPWNGLDLANLIQRYYAALPPGSHPNWVLSNHDRSRLASRIGPERVPGALALLLTLKGTPTLYYGDELGLPDAPVDGAHARDCAELRAPGLGLGRDPQRMPMPWREKPARAGFTPDDVESWLPIPSWAGRFSVESQELSPRSVLCLVKELLMLRRELAVLRRGDITVLSAHPDHLAYLRGDGEDAVLVAVNLSERHQSIAFSGTGRALWSSHATAGERDQQAGAIDLAPFEARLLAVT
ncbi:alpha-amylase family glycosyl hydrolase [Nonomuraea guangzhouensis]|uniref:Alpha-amylase family glycosyl hydrolase n=1 Tax=Nonomuraea guangzhouensis TaxID=1291555 RepID=A0ABW4GVK7_9ACTN|nr:alpha-amylase family glycosyl hydrolase [Nonomuraea guangzhouensis]